MTINIFLNCCKYIVKLTFLILCFFYLMFCPLTVPHIA